VAVKSGPYLIDPQIYIMINSSQETDSSVALSTASLVPDGKEASRDPVISLRSKTV